jgi:hypothetical protein
MSPTSRLRPAPSRSHGTHRGARRVRLLVLLTGVLVLLIAASAHAAGTVLEGWGPAEALGLGTQGSASISPTPLPVPDGATAAALGGYDQDTYGNAFVLTPSGVYSAGIGWLGFGGPSRTVPAPFTLIPGTAGATAVAAGDGQALILQADGTVLGINEGTPTPTPIAGLSDVTAVASGYSLSLALEGNGTVWTVEGTPTQVVFPPGTPKVTAIAVGYSHALALLEDGSVWAWGQNEAGQVGNGTAGGPVAAPVQVIAPPAAPGAPRVTAVTAGAKSSYALFSDGTFEAWGYNESGALGLGNGGAGELPDGYFGVDTPTAPTESYPPLTQISAIGYTTYAIAREYESAPGVFVNGAVLILGEPFQREGRLQGVSWLGVGVNGQGEIAADTPALQPVSDEGKPKPDLPFYSQALGSVGAPQGIEVVSGAEPTTISRIYITGEDPGDFELADQNISAPSHYQKPGINEALPLTVGAPLTGDPTDLGALHIWVRFIPQGLGERTATLWIEGEGEITSIELAGNGTEPPGNTPGETGPAGTTVLGPPGPAGINGTNGTNGTNGKNGVVVFAAAASKASVKPGHVATLHFGLGNGTTGAFPKTSLQVSAPKGLDLHGSRSATVASLGAGKSRTVTLRLRVGAKARRGVYKVKVTWKLGSRTVIRTVQVRVT